jgi:hypothetical protein
MLEDVLKSLRDLSENEVLLHWFERFSMTGDALFGRFSTESLALDSRSLLVLNIGPFVETGLEPSESVN